MSASQIAGKAVNAASKAAGKQVGERGLNKGARRDPELYVLGSLMAGAFGLVGYYFGTKPTSATSEAQVSIAHGSMPWNAEANKNDDFKYKYHPGGDQKNAPKEAPSALHTVVVPNVNLPKVRYSGWLYKAKDYGYEFEAFPYQSYLHEEFNKWGKDGF